MTDAEIFKVLKQRYIYLENQGYEILFIALQGSQNYNQALYTDEYKSDIDCMAVVIPSVDSFIRNEDGISTTIVLDNNEHINLKDVTNIFHLWKKQNIQFLEILFTKYKIINKKYKDILDKLFEHREAIAHIDKLTCIKSIKGMASQKYYSLSHPYPSKLHLIEKYGYDGKQLHHLMRLSAFIKNYYEGMPFEDCLITYSQELNDEMLRAKLNRYSLEEAEKLAEKYMLIIEGHREVANLNLHDRCVNEDTLLYISNLIDQIIKRSMIEQLVPKIEEKEKIMPDSYKGNIFITADLHFGHANILDFQDNRWSMLDTTKPDAIKETVQTSYMNLIDSLDKAWEEIKRDTYKRMIYYHDEALIQRWNSKVKKNDLVYILGDFSFHTAQGTMDILKRLNGKKILIEGNHDMIYLDDKKFDRSLFEEITSYKEVKYKGNKLCLMHYLIQEYRNKNKEENFCIHLHGHIHDAKFNVPKHTYNVGIDKNNCEIISLDYAIQKALENTDGDIN